jgi:class 3 adenylate cyclase/tetratricopeptide (TPR) repeat protein
MGSNHCNDCGQAVSARARFCEGCGAPLTPGARPLRAPSALEARILSERAGITGERKQVTVMYTDIVGSMELTSALDSERWGLVLDRFLAMSARAVHAFEGTVNQFTGDGLLAVFGAPLAHEDHARRACLAVLELQREVAGLAAEVAQQDGAVFAIRCGLNSGEVVVGAIGDDVHMDFVPVGNTTALGKRIEELAPVGSTAMSAATAALVEGEFELRDLGEFEVKGMKAPQRVLELVGRGPAQTRLQAIAATRGLSQFVGRDAERAALESALGRARAGQGLAVGIVGDAGVGKSRLVHEFATDCAARGVAVSVAGGVAHGRFVPFLPVLALYRDAFGIDEGDVPDVVRARVESRMVALDPDFAADLPLLHEFLGIDDADPLLAVLDDPLGRRRRLLEAAIRALTKRSTHETVVLILEDLHWFDDASDAFLEELVEALAGTRILLVATYRSEYDDSWTQAEAHRRISLGPLGPAETEDLLLELLGKDVSLDGLASLVETRTGGNPFFIEEVVQALVEKGQLTGDRGEYRLVTEVADLVLPATVQAGLAARIDRLPAQVKTLVQTMAVIGLEIPEPLLAEVSGLDGRGLVEAMAVLEQGQWVLPRGELPRREYVFKHPLTQEVAYRSQLSQWRIEAHRRVAAAIERTYPDALDERAALVAHHYEGAEDARGAAHWHARAAAWAEIASPAEGMRHWRRVRDLVPGLEASPERDELAARSRVGILSLGWRLGISPDESAEINAEAGGEVERQPVLDLFHSGLLMHSGHEREGLEGFRTAHRRAAASSDPGLTLTASTGVAYAGWVAGSLREGVEAIEDALRLTGDDPMAGAGLAFVSASAHAYHSLGMCRGYRGDLEAAHRDFDRSLVLAREYGDSETECAAHANRAMLDASVSEYAAALDAATAGLAIATQASNRVHMMACSVPAAVAQAGLGRFSEALETGQSTLASAREHRIGLYFEPVLLATIARSLLALGRRDHALVAAESAAELAQTRGLATSGLAAPLALARVLAEVEGVAAAGRIGVLLARAQRVARASDALVFESLILEEKVALASLVADDVTGAMLSPDGQA